MAHATPLRTLLIDNYDSYTFNLYQLIAAVNGAPPVVVRNDDFGGSWPALCAALAGSFDNVVISPGPGRPDVCSDFGMCADALRAGSHPVPVLGVCLGHQGLAHVHGGRVIHAPRPMHGRVSAVRHCGSGIFSRVPQSFQVGMLGFIRVLFRLHASPPVHTISRSAVSTPRTPRTPPRALLRSRCTGCSLPLSRCGRALAAGRA